MSPVVKPVAFFKPAGLIQTLGLDYKTPKQQAFPTTAAGVIAGHTAAAIWTCDEASGNLVDKIGSEALVPTSSPLQDRNCAGLFNGTSLYGKKGVEFVESETKEYISADTNFLDIDGSTSIAMLAVFKETEKNVSNRTFLGKYDGDGYIMQLRSNGQVRISVVDDVGGSDLLASSSGGSFETGEWNAVLWSMDRNTGNHEIITTFGTQKTQAITVADLSNGNGFAIGDGNATPAAQVAYVAVFTGSDAEGFTQAKLDTFWTQATDPSTGGIFPTGTYNRASNISPIAGYEAGFGDVVAKFGSGQFAHGYSGNFAHATKLGMVKMDVGTNLVTHSENQAGWTQVSTTLGTNGAESPDRTQTADILTATAANGRSQSDGMVLAVATEYTLSVWIRRNQGTDVNGTLYLRNLDTPGAQGSVAYTATDEWVRHDFQVTTDGVDVNYSFWTDITTDTESIQVWGYQCEAWAYATPCIPTTTAAATRLANTADMVNPGGQTYRKSAQGEVEVVFTLFNNTDVGGDDRYLFFVHDGAGSDTDGMTMYVDSSNDRAYVIVDDTTGAAKISSFSEVIADWADAEHTIRCRWDSVNVIEGYAYNGDQILDGARVGEDTVTWTAGDKGDAFDIGDRGGPRTTDGIIATVKCWNAPREDVP